MSTSLLNSTFELKGIQHKSTHYEEDNVIFSAQMTSKCRKCPSCKSKRHIFKGQKIRRFMLPPIGNKKCFLDLNIRRYFCTECKKVWWQKLKFMRGKSPITKPLEKYIISLLHVMTIDDVSKLIGVHWNVVKKIHKRYLKKKYKNISLSDLRYMSIDEISIRKRHKYMTVVSNIETKKVIFAIEGRSTEVLSPFLKKVAREAPNLKAVAIDMSTSYISAVCSHLPKVDIVLDHFHITAMMNKALDSVRKEQQSTLSRSELKVLKGSRFLFLRNYETLEEEDVDALETILKVNEPLFKAHTIKEQFREFWYKTTRRSAKKFLSKWGIDAIKTEIEPLKKLSLKFWTFKEMLLSHLKHKINNGFAEGLNNKIKTLKRQAYGFRDIEYFKLRLYHLHQQKYSFVG